MTAIIVRLVLAALFGGIIGYQRELTDRPAGFSTHVMVSVGAALFMLVSVYLFKGVPVDPTRIAAQVVTGVGFLGAGTIIRQGNIVLGLTTAASLWSVSAVGLAAGAGFYSAALVGTVMVFAALSVFKSIEGRLIVSREHRIIRLVIFAGPDQINRIDELLKEKKIEVESIERDRQERGKLLLRLELTFTGARTSEQTFRDLADLDEVQSVRWEL